MPALQVSLDTPIRLSLSALNTDGYLPYWSMGELAVGSVQCTLSYDGAFGTGGTVTLQYSLDGGMTWISMGTTFTSAGAQTGLDIPLWTLVRPKLTALGTGSPAGYATFYMHAVGAPG